MQHNTVFMEIPPKKTYRCKKGHTVVSEGDITFRLSQGEYTEDINVCFQCLAAFLRDFELTEEPPA